jgi:DNA-binding transcriptional LysR family regulator
MERRQLEYFLAVVDHGGFTNAARASRVAQPSLSHGVAALEAEVGGSLFHRLPHGAELTPAGKALVGPARQIVRDLATAAASVHEVLGLSGGRLEIVAQTAFAVDPLATMLGQFLRAAPKVRVEVTHPERGSEVNRLVRTGESELGLVNATVPIPGLDGIDLAEQELLLAFPPGHPYGDRVAVGVEDLAVLQFVVTPEGTEIRDVLDDVAEEWGIEPGIAVETAHRAMVVPLVLAGAGVSILPKSMADDAVRQGALVCSVKPALRYRGRLVWRSGPLTPAADRFIEIARSYRAHPRMAVMA